MDNFSIDNNLPSLCRVCAKTNENLVPIFSTLEDVLVASIITEFTAVEISKDDGLPEHVCAGCVDDIKQFIAFIERARNSDRCLRRMFKTVVKVESDKANDTADENDCSPALEEIQLEEAKIESQSQCSESEMQYFEKADCSSYFGDDRSQEESKTDNNTNDDNPVVEKKRRRRRKPCAEGEAESETQELEQLDEIEMQVFQVVDVGDQILCCTCLKLFDTAAEVKQHSMKEHAPSRRINYSKKHKCELCLRMYCSAPALKLHRKKVSGIKKVYDCLRCDARFAASQSRRNHAHHHPAVKIKSSIIVAPIPIDAHEKLGKICCSRQCYEAFETEEQLLNHAAKVHRANKIYSDLVDNELRPVECPICFKRFADENGLKCHQQRIYAPRKYVCSICGKKFHGCNELQRHEREHRNEKIFECKLCPKAYYGMEHLKAHMKRHTATREHMCTICGQSYLQKHGLQTHMLMHEGKLPFECDICEKAFRTKAKLMYHNRVHSGEKPFPCRYCDKAFADGTNRMRHEMSHTGVKPYKCDHCEKTFITKRLRKEHENTHRDRKTFQCPECLISFSSINALESHNTTVHCDTLEVVYTD
ncbi:zinc finger protein 260-like [Sabethes cyaneus]|uniref:zinc finger protein 260-like n=1 Tax=Sabethes cyaneus TaxID=53552 RepID=UPI00237E020F|nr:zinc finger protein 260-like [Sabethes cyaneus]